MVEPQPSKLVVRVRFSSPAPYIIGNSPSGKATDFDSVIHRFKSCIPSQFYYYRHGPIAQSVEHLTFNQGVPRSSRGWITNTERYRSGHNGAVLKTVRVQAHVGSNPTLSAIYYFAKQNFKTKALKISVSTRRSTQVAEEAPLLRE